MKERYDLSTRFVAPAPNPLAHIFAQCGHVAMSRHFRDIFATLPRKGNESMLSLRAALSPTGVAYGQRDAACATGG